jgi:reticulon-4-interacting protein 1, mitochondrial
VLPHCPSADLLQVIDYRANAPLHKYLSSRYKDNPFDVIVDAVGVQKLFDFCPSYLREKGTFVSVGAAFASWTLPSLLYAAFVLGLKNLYLPIIFGGVPRKYIQVVAAANYADMQSLADMTVERKLKVIIDSGWDMDDAQKVRHSFKISETQRVLT